MGSYWLLAENLAPNGCNRDLYIQFLTMNIAIFIKYIALCPTLYNCNAEIVFPEIVTQTCLFRATRYNMSHVLVAVLKLMHSQLEFNSRSNVSTF